MILVGFGLDLAWIWLDFGWIWLDSAWLLVHYSFQSSRSSPGGPRKLQVGFVEATSEVLGSPRDFLESRESCQSRNRAKSNRIQAKSKPNRNRIESKSNQNPDRSLIEILGKPRTSMIRE